jgi:nitrate/nitrite transporter NarK
VETAGKIAGTAMAFYAILNGLGRIMWGWVSDKIGRKTALIAMCIIQGEKVLAYLPDDQPADPGFAAEQPMGAFAIQNRCFAKKIP